MKIRPFPRQPRMKAARRAVGLSQTDLAYLLGSSPTVISNIENGWVNASAERKKKIAVILGRQFSEVFPTPHGSAAVRKAETALTDSGLLDAEGGPESMDADGRR